MPKPDIDEVFLEVEEARRIAMDHRESLRSSADAATRVLADEGMRVNAAAHRTRLRSTDPPAVAAGLIETLLWHTQRQPFTPRTVATYLSFSGFAMPWSRVMTPPLVSSAITLNSRPLRVTSTPGSPLTGRGESVTR